MSTMTKEYQEKFLIKTRYGYLTTLTNDGSPRTVPVWFNWDGHTVRIFTGINSHKAQRIKQNPRVTLLVASDLNEHEAWVSFDGTAKIRLDGGFELAEQLAQKYWDLSDSSRKATLDSWKTASEHLCVIELVPERIRTYFD